MLKNEKVFAAALIMVGIIVLGCSIRSGLQSFADKERYVTVKGLAEKEVKADHVIMPFLYTEPGNSLEELYATIGAKNKKIMDFLLSHGISKDEITLSEPEVRDLSTNEYRENFNSRYMLTSVITLSTDKVDKAREIATSKLELIKQGVALQSDYAHQAIYQFTKLNEIKPKMIAEATRNAREAAQKFAEDSESKLGKIRSASQGQFSVDYRDEFTKHIQKVRVVTSVDYYLND